MKLVVIAVGRLKSGPERELCERYAARLKATMRAVGLGALQVIELGESSQRRSEDRMAEEARAILAAVPEGAMLIALDERGTMPDSDGFAAILRRQREANVPALVLVIGGPDGLGPEVRARAGEIFCFGRMTMPHQIVRALVFEQLYRATTILSGHPYHRA